MNALPFASSVIVLLVSSAMRSADFLFPYEFLVEYVIWIVALPVAAVGLVRAATTLIGDLVLELPGQRRAGDLTSKR